MTSQEEEEEEAEEEEGEKEEEKRRRTRMRRNAGPAVGSSACVLQSPSGLMCRFARAGAAPPAAPAPDLAGARLAASRCAFLRSWRDGGM
jgi:hypothetical protein